MFFLNKSKSTIAIGVLVFLLFTVLLLLFVDVAFVQAQSYTLISPLPGVGESVSSESGGSVGYLNNIFVIFVSIIAVLGVIKLMICGFQYMTREAISSKEEAKKCMAGVFMGLFLVLISVLVLQTINPNLTKLSFFAKLEQSIEGKIPAAGTSDGDDSGVDVALQHCFIKPGDDSGFNPAQEFCGDTLQSCNNTREGLILSGAQDLTSCVSQGPFQFSLINICTGNFLTQIEGYLDQCNSTVNTLLNLPRYTVIEGCFEEAGAYRYAVRESGTNCSQSRFDRFLPRGPVLNRDGPCQDALEAELAEKNYGLTQSCRDIGPSS